MRFDLFKQVISCVRFWTVWNHLQVVLLARGGQNNDKKETLPQRMGALLLKL